MRKKKISKVETDGFISQEADEGKKYIVNTYKDIFKLAKELNQFSMRFLGKQVIDYKSHYKVIIHTLLIREIEIFQAVYLLLERGMMAASKNLTRSMLEILFTVVALQKKPELLQCYLDQNEKNHFKALRAALCFKGKDLVASLSSHNIKAILEKKEAEINEKALKTLSIKRWAIEAELEDFYNLYYVTYSTATHSSLASLDDHVDEESSGVISLALGPSNKDFYEVFKCCLSSLINLMNSVGKVYNVNLSDDLDKFANILNRLDNLYLTNK